MRIRVREQICEILATVFSGVQFATEAKSGDALPVLADCMDAAAMIREALPTQLSANRAEFYERQMSIVAAGLDGITGGLESGADISETATLVLEQLDEIYSELGDESEVKLEVAFYPYKASMWDCMESIWLAARDDPRCNATVVPIRYIDKAPNGTVLAVHCERDIFPDYVPVVRFEDYNPETETPDIAYIHNPYDQHNYVTSVDPAYYSRELKKHVGTLVYVPYYVAGWKPSLTMAQTACNTAADVIILSSEQDAEMLREINPNKDYAALGSPKVDRILRFERDKPEMPPEWRDKLGGKKVFLLNTSVSTLLRLDVKFKEKLDWIISVFENRSDIALLWRPHPLSEATMKSMRPSLIEGYYALEQRVRDGSFGVLDDTADVTRAIALSDAYIGESATSLVFMFAITGKPTYLLDFDIVKGLAGRERDEILRSAYIVEPIPGPGSETALAISYDTNEICRVELETGRVTPIGDIPGCDPGDMYPYAYIADCGDKYILPPVCSDRFVELDRDFMLIRTVELPEQAKADVVFTYPVRHGDFVYFLPSRSRAFARYCVSTGEYEYLYNWYKDFEQYADETDPGIFTGFYCTAGNKLYLPCYKDNIVAELNLDTMKIKAHRVGASDNRYFSITHDGKCFWLTRFRPNDIDDSRWSDSVVRWDMKTGKTEEFKSFPEGFEPGAMSFRRIVFCGEYLLAFPHQSNMILNIDQKSGKMSEFGQGLVKTDKNTDEILPDPKNAAFGHAGSFVGDMVCGVMAKERALLTVDTKTDEMKKIMLRFDAPHKEEKRTANMWFMPPKYDKANRGIFYEHLLFAPDAFVGQVVSGEIEASVKQAEFYLGRVENPDCTSGEKIHEYVIKKFVSSEED